MRRALVAQDHATGATRFALRFAFHQHLHPMGHLRQFHILTGNDIRQLLDLFGQMSDGFFQLGDAIL